MCSFSATCATELLQSWDQQQSAYIAHREARFNTMLEVLALTLGERFHVLDAGCGPGSLTARLLARFPLIRVTALDLDPMLLAIAREALGQYGDRVCFLQGDVTDTASFAPLQQDRPQAAVSSTAIHWLMPEQQVALYRQLYLLLDDNGLFMNADHQRFDQRQPRLQALATQHEHNTQQQAWQQGVPDWDTWFARALQLPHLAEPGAARTSLFAGRPTPLPTPVDFHLTALRQAGFVETGTLWQFLDDFIVAGWKAPQAA